MIMNHIFKKPLYFALIYLLTFALFGCSTPVRHMSSDVCLVKPGNSPKEVMDVLGPPNSKKPTNTGELWTYFTAQESPLKRTPGIGYVFGTTTYDVVHVTFANNTVANCQYRHANEEEFKQSEINTKKEEL